MYRFIARKICLYRQEYRFIAQNLTNFIASSVQENFCLVFSFASTVTKILANKIVSLYSIFFSKIVYLYRFIDTFLSIAAHHCQPVTAMLALWSPVWKDRGWNTYLSIGEVKNVGGLDCPLEKLTQLKETVLEARTASLMESSMEEDGGRAPTCAVLLEKWTVKDCQPHALQHGRGGGAPTCAPAVLLEKWTVLEARTASLMKSSMEGDGGGHPPVHLQSSWRSEQCWRPGLPASWSLAWKGMGLGGGGVTHLCTCSPLGEVNSVGGQDCQPHGV